MRESFLLPDLKHTLALLISALLAWAPLTVVPRAAPGNTFANPGSGFICLKLCDPANPCASE
ncbi:hypothetical protein KJ975_08460 [Myxococcota bacterium]|nr:hypothetical protein [Myxococcota bacterium]